MSSQESNNALSVANQSLQAALRQIKCCQVDGSVVVDQAYDIAKLVSEALQQHSRNASIISPLLLSVAAEVRVTMNASLALQWERVRFDDSCIESHPFFAKTKGFVAPALAPEPNPTSVLPPAPKVMSVPLIDSLLADVPKPTADKGKQPVQGTRQSREVDSDNESKRPKRCKVSKRLSKAMISDTEDEDVQLAGPVIFVKPSKAVVPQTPAPTKQAKQMRFTSSCQSALLKDVQANTDVPMGRLTAKGKGKGKGKEKAVNLAKGDQYNPPCKRCAGDTCLIAVGRTGQIVKSCIKCYNMKVKCECPDDKLPAMTRLVQASCPWSRAGPASKSKPQPRTTRAASRACQLIPVVESEDAMEDSDVADQDIDMSHASNIKQETDVAAVMSTEPVNQAPAIASADDFTPKHWQEPADPISILPPPSPPAPIDPLTSSAEPSIHDRVVALTAQVAAMTMADHNALARVDAMEHDFDARISSMQAEFSALQLDFSATVTLVNDLVIVVENLRQKYAILNPLFPPPVMTLGHGSSATAMGMQYTTGVYGPSLAPMTSLVPIGQPSASGSVGLPVAQGTSGGVVVPNPPLADVGQGSVSRPFGQSDGHGTTFTSGQASSGSAEAGPSSHFPVKLPASETRSLP
ncbi:hypothetical protein BDR03DRAFT_986964 [Suillus americanus]|nr:hypothetical protein BDR03DRAFT_986964 [Suillus americanus]